VCVCVLLIIKIVPTRAVAIGLVSGMTCSMCGPGGARAPTSALSLALLTTFLSLLAFTEEGSGGEGERWGGKGGRVEARNKMKRVSERQGCQQVHALLPCAVPCLSQVGTEKHGTTYYARVCVNRNSTT
jgi:hypothetical protein